MCVYIYIYICVYIYIYIYIYIYKRDSFGLRNTKECFRWSLVVPPPEDSSWMKQAVVVSF